MRDSRKKHQVEIVSYESKATRSVFADEEVSLLANLLQNNIEMDHSCGGNGTCGTCRIVVLDGFEKTSEIGEIEAEMRLDREFDENERLSCQTYIKGNIKITIP